MDPPAAPTSWLLAHINVAHLVAPLDDPTMAELAAALDRLHQLAEAAPGFLWRLPNGHRHTAPADDHPDPTIFFNVSVWESYEHLHNYVYRTRHGHYVRRRARWFRPTPPPSTALWWIGPTDRPTADEAFRRLAYLRRYGPSPRAFTVRRRFTPQGRPEPRHRRS